MSYEETRIVALYRGARDTNPPPSFFKDWNNASPLRKQYLWDQLQEEAACASRTGLDRAYIEFWDRVKAIGTMGAGDNATAIKWLLQAEGLERKTPAFLCQHFNLPPQYAHIFNPTAPNRTRREATTITGAPNEHYVFYRGE